MTAAAPVASSRHLPLDGLRGVAILAVVLFHLADSFGRSRQTLLPLLGGDVLALLLNGWAGVHLFFALSGYLIMRGLLAAEDSGAALRSYARRRAWRILPTYLVVLALVLVGAFPYYAYEQGHVAIRALYHLLFLQDYLPSSFLGPLWSLGVEVKFYLVAPFIALLLRRRASPRAGAAILLLLMAIPLAVRILMVFGEPATGPRSFEAVWRNPFHLSMDALLAGALVGWIERHRGAFPRVTTAGAARGMLVVAAGGIVAVLGLSATRPGTLFAQVALYPLVAVLMGLIVAVAVLHPRALRFLTWRPLTLAGRIAYPWYLVHVPVMWFAWGLTLEAAPQLAALPRVAQLALFLPVSVGLSALAAVGLHLVVERPGMEHGRGRRPRRTPAGGGNLQGA